MQHTLTQAQRTRLDGIRRIANPVAAAVAHRHDITSVKKNGSIRIGTTHFLVLSVSTYTEEDWDWKKKPAKPDVVTELELLNLATGEKTYLEWSKDDEVEMCLTERELRLRDLCDDERQQIDDTDLPQIVEDEDSVFLNGRRFDYDDDDSWAAGYRRDGTAEVEYLRSYEFACGESYLSIEEWFQDGKGKGRKTHKVYLSRPVRASEVKVLALGSD